MSKINSIQIYSYGDNPIEFELGSKNVLVNATEMAKPFPKNKRPVEFLRLASTKDFIEKLLSTGGNSHQLKEKTNPILGNWWFEKETDLVIKKDRSITWMHPVLAMPFAFWLDYMFSLWLIGIMNKLQNKNSSHTEYLKEKTKLRLEIEQEEMKIRQSEIYKKVEEKKAELKKLNREESTRTVRYIEQELPLWFPEEKKD